MRHLTYITLVIFIAAGCQHAKFNDVSETLDIQLLNRISEVSPTGDYHYYVLPESSDYSNIPQDPMNPVTGVKKALGQMLFHETALATQASQATSLQTFSCATCHIAGAGFKPGAQQGIADGGLGFGELGEGRIMNPLYEEEEIDAQGARPLSLVNAAFVKNALWNGQFGAGDANEGTEDVWNDKEDTKINFLGHSGVESNNIESLKTHRMLITPELVEFLGYTSLYDQAFPEIPEEERYNNYTTALALAAYLRTIMSTEAPFQSYLSGNYEALSEQEKEGAMLFFDKAGCYRCHNNTALGANTFHALGVGDLYQRGGLKTSKDDPRNLGRGNFTGRAEDMHRFKVPQLYNLKDTPFYFHGSSKESLRDVVIYFNDAIPENPDVPAENISDLLTPLSLTDSEIDALTAFLSEGLHDPYLERYAPSRIYSGNCFPNADDMSSTDLGCE